MNRLRDVALSFVLGFTAGIWSMYLILILEAQ